MDEWIEEHFGRLCQTSWPWLISHKKLRSLRVRQAQGLRNLVFLSIA